MGLSLFSLIITPLVAIEKNISIAATPMSRLEDWRFYPESLQLEIRLSGGTQPSQFYLRQPERIVVDLPDTKLGFVPTRQDYNGDIKSIRVSQFDENTTRIVLDIAPGTFIDPNQVQLQPFSWQNLTRWVLSAGNSRYISNSRVNSFPSNPFNNYPNQVQPYFPPQPNINNDFPPNSYPNQVQPSFPPQLNTINTNNFSPNNNLNQQVQPYFPPQLNTNNFSPNNNLNQQVQPYFPPQLNTNNFSSNHNLSQLQQTYFPPQPNTNNFPFNNNSNQQVQPYFPPQLNTNNLLPINNQQPPLVTVPPLNSNTPSQPFNNMLPPPSFDNFGGN
ncbi:MAG: AMIN domain-containing protein [Nostocaceae cyanobacterium]|nr:AMIN domain-containing protein [Nostocaceae cyanobacterium]